MIDGTALELEVWVVDNDSVDGSVDMIRHDFPEVNIIENHENVGFARANNQALARCSGGYMLLLNPDTVVEHHTRLGTFAETNLDSLQRIQEIG